MRKEFYQDFKLNGVEKVEILSSKVDYNSFKRGSVNLINNLKLTTLDETNEKDFIICLDEFLPNLNDNQYLNIDVVNISYVLTCSRLTLYGEIEINIFEKEEANFKIDPFKESLLKSFINYKRNLEDVDIISTINENEKLDINEIEKVNEIQEVEDTINEDLVIPYQEKKLDENDNYLELKIVDDNKSIAKKNEELLKEKYISPYFYYRVGKNENINDILTKFNISLVDFQKYNSKSEYLENSLVKIKKNEK